LLTQLLSFRVAVGLPSVPRGCAGCAIICTVKEDERAAALLARYSLHMVAGTSIVAVGAGAALAAAVGLVAAIAATCFILVAALVATRP
jgi:hypothetical protein